MLTLDYTCPTVYKENTLVRYKTMAKKPRPHIGAFFATYGTHTPGNPAHITTVF